MIGYPYIQEVFTNILKESSVIQGRFYISPNWGTDINSSTLQELIGGVEIPESQRISPLCVMMPPKSSGNYMSDQPVKDANEFCLLFLTPSFYTSTGDVKEPRPDIPNKSGHTIPEDWHDMKRCARDFMQVLGSLIRDTDLDQYFIISGKNPQEMVMVSTVGTNRMSGVKLTFTGILQMGCALEDYPNDYLSRITIPSNDSHPTHLH